MPGYKRNSRARRRFAIKIDKQIAKKIVIVVTPIIVLAIMILGIKTYQSNVQIENEKKEAQQKLDKVLNSVDYSKIEGEKPVAQDNVINIIALGNIICEPELYESLYDEINESYLFIRFLNRIQQYIGVADYTIGNLEMNFVNLLDRKNGKPVAPEDLGVALKNAGVDLINTASPNSNDYGRNGIEQTLKYINSLKLGHIGTYETQEESEKIKIVNIRNIKVAFLAYTENLNTAVSAKEKYLVNRIDETKMNKDIQTAKDQGAEFILVCLNWGDSKAKRATDAQRNLAKKLVDNGANVVIGTHPNMAFEIEKIKNQDGKDACIIYSLGNFMSLQEKMQISLNIEITKSIQDDQVRLTNVTYIPMYLIDKGKGAKERYFLSDVNLEIIRYDANVESNLSDDDYKTVQEKLVELKNRLQGE